MSLDFRGPILDLQIHWGHSGWLYVVLIGEKRYAILVEKKTQQQKKTKRIENFYPTRNIHPLTTETSTS